MFEPEITQILTKVREDHTMKKRTAGLLGIFLAAAMMTAGCGSDSSQEAAKDTEQKAEDNASEAEDTTEAKGNAGAADEKTERSRLLF